MTTNRGMIKWQPFSAVASGTYMINNVLKEKNKIKKPILSEDQKIELQNKMVDSYNNQEKIIVKYFRDGRLYTLEGKITEIDINKHRISINNHFWVFFSQIVDFY